MNKSINRNWKGDMKLQQQQQQPEQQWEQDTLMSYSDRSCVTSQIWRQISQPENSKTGNLNQ